MYLLSHATQLRQATGSDEEVDLGHIRTGYRQ